MRIFIVVSEVTFVKENYNGFLEELFKHYPGIAGLIVLTNNQPILKVKAFGLMLMGAKRIGMDLMRNTINAAKKDHEKIAKKYNIPTYYFKSANDPAFYNLVKEKQIDLIVNARTRDIYKNKILKAPKLGCINIHHGILPNYRGTMCDLHAIFEDRPAGFSVHKMEKKIDDGDIIKVVEVTSKTNDRYQEYLNYPLHIYESSKCEGKIMAEILKDIKEHQQLNFQFKNQSSNVKYTKNPDHQMIKKMLKKGIIL